MIGHADLVVAAHRWLAGSQRHTAVLAECGSVGFEVPDVIGWLPNGFSTLVECKASRADFRADAAKTFRRHPETGMGYWRWFFVPKGLVRPDEVPAGWGLAELRGERVFKIVKPVPFHDRAVRHECELLVSAVERLTTGRGLKVFAPQAASPIWIAGAGERAQLFTDYVEFSA